jgi:hypothetical protein
VRRAAAAAACTVALTAAAGAQQFEVHQVEIGAGPWFVFADLDPESGTMHHFVADTSGEGPVQALLHTPPHYRIERWLDERHLLVVGLVASRDLLFVVDARAGSQRALGVETWDHHVSGQRIVFQADRRLGTVRWDRPEAPRWLLDRTFQGLQLRGGFAFGLDQERIWRIDLASGESQPVGPAPVTAEANVSVSPDGARLAISTWSQRPPIECRGPTGPPDPLRTGWGMVHFAEVAVFGPADLEPSCRHETARVGRYTESDRPRPPTGTWLDGHRLVLHRFVADEHGDRLVPIAHDLRTGAEHEVPPAIDDRAADEPVDDEHHYRVPSPDGNWQVLFTGHPGRLVIDDEPTTSGDVELVHTKTGARRRLGHTDVVSWRWLPAR